MIKIKQNCLNIASRQSVSARDLAQLIGRLTATNQAVLPSPLHYRSLQLLKTKALHTGGNYDHHVQLDEDSKQELIWWSSKMERESFSPSPTKHYCQIRCKPERLGCNLSKYKNGRSLDGK